MDKKICTVLFLIFAGVAEIVTSGCLEDDVLERFLYTKKGKYSKTNDENYLEFLVIGKSVSWHEAQAYCPSYEIKKASRLTSQNVVPEARIAFDFSAEDKKKVSHTGSKLAVVDDMEIKNWLAGMLSESNYLYDGLWIGGYKKKSAANWTWIGEKSDEDSIIPQSVLNQNYPSWLGNVNQEPSEQNCLLFNRLGHDMPVFLPENCYLRRPFICVRVGRKKEENLVEQVGNTTVDGYQYTLYGTVNKQNPNNFNQLGIRKLNGGGIKWKTARLECRIRGQQLATVLTNEAASAIAEVMLKSRPSMESAWLGGWSLDGSEWTWITSGTSLSSKKSSATSYPPWLESRPIIYENKFGDEGLGRENIAEPRANFEDQDRDIMLNDKTLQFSAKKMNWNEGDKHCKNKNGHIGSIYDSKTLSIVLSKMTELSLDHLWIGGHTKKFGNEWKWVDEKDKVLSRKGVGITSSWCLQSDKSGSLLKADPETCLNLDREGHGLPLFYGLPCDLVQQHVLCHIRNFAKNSSIESENIDSALNNDNVNHLENNNEEIAPRFFMLETKDKTIKSDLSSQLEVNKGNQEENNISTTIIYDNGDMNVTEKYFSSQKIIGETTNNSETSTLDSLIEPL
ncbi:uncharacterized protein LOC117175090 isoform X2 [Belonocnema kinseyi]|uniref:uncharacterized protein LOC117175090 isoform X2 n=1 Tax=Belonocnema kinseyi TaxID=2817044 RepID=UPI00143CC150|nr:uncharacterized protein LOC117175090 isoform X2 [Belonocnema kinseyi]